MIECKHILALCDRFQDYLMPPDIHVLRRRYNGKTLKFTYALARDMGLSDEPMHVIENRAFNAIKHGLDPEANRQAIAPMWLAQVCRQPMASEI
jgi:hypothetical protein